MAARKSRLWYCQLPQQPTTAAYLPFPLSYVPVCNQRLWVHMRRISELVHDNLHCPTSMRVMWSGWGSWLWQVLYMYTKWKGHPLWIGTCRYSSHHCKKTDLALYHLCHLPRWAPGVYFVQLCLHVVHWFICPPLWTNVWEMGGSTTGRVIPAGVILAVAYL